MFSQLVYIDTDLAPYFECTRINHVRCWCVLCAWSSFDNANYDAQFMGE
jgi:hypothetical protein